MQPQFILADVLKFIIRHRRAGKAFKDWSYCQIAESLERAAARNAIFVVHENNCITGMVLAWPEVDNTLYIEQILCTTRSAVLTLVKGCQIVFKGRDLVYMRSGEYKQISTKRLAFMAKQSINNFIER